MDITFNCEKCGQHMVIEEAGAGMTIQCPKCEAANVVPRGSTVRVAPGAFGSKRLVLVLIAGVIVLATLISGVFAYSVWRNDKKEQEKARVEAARIAAEEKVKRDELIAAENAKREINIGVFIRTAGGENIKCGLVTVSVFDEETIRPWQTEVEKAIQKRLAQYESLLDATSTELKTISLRTEPRLMNINAKNVAIVRAALKLRIECVRWPRNVGALIINQLPKALTTAKTDADGKCHLTVKKPGKYALAAKFSRLVGEETEDAYWLVCINLRDKPPMTVMLSNDNTIDSGNSDNVFVKISDLKMPPTQLRDTLKDLRGFLKQVDQAEQDFSLGANTTESEYIFYFIIRSLRSEWPKKRDTQ
jgi:phage FluMu protein Com